MRSVGINIFTIKDKPAATTLKIFDLSGKEVVSLLNEKNAFEPWDTEKNLNTERHP